MKNISSFFKRNKKLSDQYLFGNSTPFVLLSHQRSGSSMLIQTFREHPDIQAFGELFKDYGMGFNVDGYQHLNNDPQTERWRNKKPERFLEKKIFLPNKTYGAVGFKLFPKQMETFQRVSRWLQKRDPIRVIALKRWNSLKMYTSLSIAKKTKTFGIGSADERPQETVKLDPSQTLAFIEEHEKRWEDHLSLFNEHSVYFLYYEDLMENFEQHLQELLSFINVPYKSLDVSSVKKEVRPLNQVIENYDEIEEALTGTRWEAFLDPDPDEER